MASIQSNLSMLLLGIWGYINFYLKSFQSTQSQLTYSHGKVWIVNAPEIPTHRILDHFIWKKPSLPQNL